MQLGEWRKRKMFAELKSREAISKSIVECWGEDEKDTRRIEFSKIYNNIPPKYTYIIIFVRSSMSYYIDNILVNK